MLLEDTDKFAAVFDEKLATYALRRGITFGDWTELRRLVDQSRPGGHKLAAIIESFVAGDLFLK